MDALHASFRRFDYTEIGRDDSHDDIDIGYSDFGSRGPQGIPKTMGEVDGPRCNRGAEGGRL